MLIDTTKMIKNEINEQELDAKSIGIIINGIGGYNSIFKKIPELETLMNSKNSEDNTLAAKAISMAFAKIIPKLGDNMEENKKPIKDLLPNMIEIIKNKLGEGIEMTEIHTKPNVRGQRQ